MKKNDNYIPQFDMAMNDELHLLPGLCVLCNKTCDYLSEEELCYQCATDIKVCEKNIESQVSPDYIKPYISNKDNSQSKDNPKPRFTFFKTYYGFMILGLLFLSMALAISVSRIFLVLFFPSLTSFYFVRENVATIRNIKVLKRIRLYELAQKETDISYYKGCSFSRNFVYNATLAIPIIAIKEVNIAYRRTRGNILVLTLKSDESFIISAQRFGTADLKCIKEKLLRLNPTIVSCL